MTAAWSFRGDPLLRGRAQGPSRPGGPVAARAAEAIAGSPAAWDWIFQLERLSQSGVMASGFASAVLNALTAVAGTCQLGLLEKDPARMRDALARAGEVAMRAAESANVFLTFVRPASASAPASRCATVVDDALRFVAPAVRSVGAVVDVDVPDDLAVACDRGRLLQTVIDVLVFLLRSDGEPGLLLRISAHRDGDIVTIRVQDDGSGLSPSVAEHMFEPFLVATASATGETPLGDRAGLGLFLTRRIVEDLGGSIEVEPCVPHGSAVSLRLPAAADERDGRGVGEGTQDGTVG